MMNFSFLSSHRTPPREARSHAGGRRLASRQALPSAVRERRRLVRYLGAGQARFGTQKRHLSSENLRWRFYLLVLFTAIVVAGLVSLLREIG